MFFKGSRYGNVETLTYKDDQGRTLLYKSIRFIPAASAFRMHEVRQGERLDLIADEHYRDPERFWRICDANLAAWPPDLVAEHGRYIVIPPSEE
jgi:hypothetical protein